MNKLCGCGCGQEIKSSSTYALGHHWRAKRLASGTDSKECEYCGREYFRNVVRQNDAHWAQRRYCSADCFNAARAVTDEDGRIRCAGCGEYKPPVAFYRSKASLSGARTRCKECTPIRKTTYAMRREGNLRHLYGIGIAEYDVMLAAQGGVCAICGEPETAVRCGRQLSLAVDHCHETKRIRGLLCNNCNRGIGGLKHDEVRLRAAIKYLKRTA